jgi:hypothetical protein
LLASCSKTEGNVHPTHTATPPSPFNRAASAQEWQRQR